MRLEFEATADDYVVIQAEWAQRSGRHFNQPTGAMTWGMFFLSFGAAGGFAAAMQGARDADAIVIGTVCGFLAGGIAWVVLGALVQHNPWYQRRAMASYRELIRRNIEAGHYPADLGPQALTIGEESLEFETPRRLIRYSPGVFGSLEDREDDFLLLRGNHIEIRVPKRAFASEQQQQEFRRLVQPYLAARGAAELG